MSKGYRDKYSQYGSQKQLSLVSKLYNLQQLATEEGDGNSIWDTLINDKTGLDSSAAANFDVHLDMASGEVSVSTSAQDTKGRPLFEWSFKDDLETLFKRAKDGSQVTMIQK